MRLQTKLGISVGIFQNIVWLVLFSVLYMVQKNQPFVAAGLLVAGLAIVCFG
jgi:hypothetical protein